MDWTRAAMNAAVVGTLFGGCCGGSEDATNEPEMTRPGRPTVAGPVQVPLPRSEGAATTPPDMQAIVDAARTDAASRTGAPAPSVIVMSADAVVWSDGSLGCPLPGTMYTMALVPGYRVRIRVGESILDYHAGGRQMILCPPGRAVDPTLLQTR